jgi:O-antigen ligase
MTSRFSQLKIPGKHQLALAFYGLFMAGFFLIPNAVDQYKLFSFSVFLVGLFLLRPAWQALSGKTLFLLVAAYLVWMLMATLWSSLLSVDIFVKYLRLVAYILTFMLVTAYLAHNHSKQYQTLTTMLVYIAAAAAVISIPLWYLDQPFPESRLVGIGTLDNPNTSAFVYGFFAVVACKLALASSDRSVQLRFSACVLLLGLFVILTQSNTGILATCSALAILLLLDQRNRKHYLLGGLIITTGAVLFLVSSLGLSGKNMDAGFKKRFPIWQQVSEQIAEAPILGHGFPKTIVMDETGQPAKFNYSHNALLASLRDGGLVAGGLHLAFTFMALILALRHYRRSGDPIYLAYLGFACTCMLVDTDQLITRPRETWVILWWPLAMLAAKAPTDSASD